jgi:curved DNA-binding protein CbpA
VQNFYQLLAVESTATAEEIKRAFRLEIARYHPDKVQHLGKEFQEMAATRAAQLTEAYRTLMNPELRAEYDRHHAGSTPAPLPKAAAPPTSPQAPPGNSATDAPPPSHPDPGFTPPPRFAQEHATRDEFVRKAMLTRLRQVLNAEYGNIKESETKGFHFDCSAKPKKLFGRGGAQRFAVRFVQRGDRAALQDVWAAAQKAGGPICVFLMGNSLAPARELGDAIAAMRKRSRGEANVCIIPIDVRDWTAHIPADAPSICKTVIQRLRESTV